MSPCRSLVDRTAVGLTAIPPLATAPYAAVISINDTDELPKATDERSLPIALVTPRRCSSCTIGLVPTVLAACTAGTLSDCSNALRKVIGP